MSIIVVVSIKFKSIQKSGEDYLEAIYNLLLTNNQVRSIDIANILGVTKPSTSRALNILADRGYVIKEKYGAVSLTQKGIEHAKEIQKKHKAVRMLLVDVLGIDVAVAEIDACKIEHCLSEESAKKLYEFLKIE